MDGGTPISAGDNNSNASANVNLAQKAQQVQQIQQVPMNDFMNNIFQF